MKAIPVGLTLYTVRDQLEKDYPGTIERIREIGYRHIEIGGFGPFSTREWKDLLARLGLGIMGNHIPLDLLEQSLNHVAEFNLEIGNPNLVVPFLPAERRADADGYRRVAESLNAIGSRCRNLGVRLYYHNHSFEFEDLNGTTGHRMLMENTDPQCVSFQFDTYWIKHGGQDPAQYIRKHSNRVGLVHLKDMSADKDRSFAEVGEGILDFTAIFKAALDANVEWFSVEQDRCPRPSLESAKMSYRNIQKLESDLGMQRTH